VHWARSVVSRSIAELSFDIVAPTVAVAPWCRGARMCAAGLDDYHRRKTNDANGCRTIRCRTVA